jgi:hypothetical protein
VSSARGEGRERRVTTKSPRPAGALASLGGSSATRPVGNRHLDQGLRANLGLSPSQRSGTTVARPSLSDCHIRTSGLPIKPKIQCTQPCTTDFPENMGDLTEEMANATAQ